MRTTGTSELFRRVTDVQVDMDFRAGSPRLIPHLVSIRHREKAGGEGDSQQIGSSAEWCECPPKRTARS